MSDKPHLDHRGRRKLAVLTRRAGYLREVIAATDDTQRGRDYDKAELGALEFAVATIRDHYAPVEAP